MRCLPRHHDFLTVTEVSRWNFELLALLNTRSRWTVRRSTRSILSARSQLVQLRDGICLSGCVIPIVVTWLRDVPIPCPCFCLNRFQDFRTRRRGPHHPLPTRIAVTSMMSLLTLVSRLFAFLQMTELSPHLSTAITTSPKGNSTLIGYIKFSEWLLD